MELSDLKGKTWTEVVEVMTHSAHAFAFDDAESLEVARVAFEYGPEAGAGVACAILFAHENHTIVTAYAAIEIYEKLLPGDKRFEDLRYWMAYVGQRPFNRPDVWPIKPEVTGAKLAGIANVMMALAAREMMEGTTTWKLAGGMLFEFLHEGMKKKSKKSGKRKAVSSV